MGGRNHAPANAADDCAGGGGLLADREPSCEGRVCQRETEYRDHRRQGVAGAANLAGVAKSENIVALCDVDERRAGVTFERYPNVPQVFGLPQDARQDGSADRRGSW